MSQLVTVKIPVPKVEKLSSRERTHGKQARKGWLKNVTSIDRSQRGGFALVGPWLHEGEAQLPVGAVVVESHYDGDCRVSVVAFDGALVSMRNIEADGAQFWLDSKTHTQSLCDLVSKAQSISMLDLLGQAVEGLRKRVASADAIDAEREGLTTAEARLNTYSRTWVDAPAWTTTDELVTMARARMQAEQAQSDPARVVDPEGVARVRALMAQYGLTVDDLK